MKKLLFLLFVMASCSSGQGGMELSSDDSVNSTGSVSTQQQVSSQKYLISKGVIRSARTVEIFSRIEGQLLEVKLLEGQYVKNGQVLFNLDDLDLKAKVYLSESQVERAQMMYEEILIGQGYKRDALDFVPSNISSYAKIKSGLNISERELNINKKKLSYSTITASQSGVVTGISALSYSFVKPGQTLCKIIDPEKLIVEFNIFETELRRFEIGVEVEVRSIAFSDEPHRAVVISLGSVVDASGMIKVQAAIDDSHNLLPGMTADVII